MATPTYTAFTALYQKSQRRNYKQQVRGKESSGELFLRLPCICFPFAAQICMGKNTSVHRRCLCKSTSRLPLQMWLKWVFPLSIPVPLWADRPLQLPPAVWISQPFSAKPGSNWPLGKTLPGCKTSPSPDLPPLICAAKDKSSVL